MFQNVFIRLAKETRFVQRSVKYAHFPRSVAPMVSHVSVSVRRFTDVKDEVQQRPFDTSLLEFLVCPLSKKPLRYEEKTSELINEELGIAYPIIDGIPNMIPQDARLIQKDSVTPPPEPTQG